MVHGVQGHGGEPLDLTGGCKRKEADQRVELKAPELA